MNKIIYPDYNNSVLNTITSILKYYGVKSNHTSLNILDEKLNKKYKNVIFLVLDGMGKTVLDDINNQFMNGHTITTVTSTSPSTTTAALNTYYSGSSPYETGWIAWSEFIKEYGRNIDMLKNTDSYLGSTIDKPMIDIYDKYFKYKNIFEKIEEVNSDISTYYLKPSYAENKALFNTDCNNIDEICNNITRLLKKDKEKFIFAYCDNPDHLLHKYGCKSDEVRDMLKDTFAKIEKLSKEMTDDTILIISADHGHKNIKKAYTILDYPDIIDLLITMPSLESRFLSFFVHEDKKEEFKELFNKYFKDEFILFSKEEVLEKHLLGYGYKHKKIDDAIGNFVAISTDGSIIRLESFLREGKMVMKSTHCGLSYDEMIVPVIVIN